MDQFKKKWIAHYLAAPIHPFTVWVILCGGNFQWVDFSDPGAIRFFFMDSCFPIKSGLIINTSSPSPEPCVYMLPNTFQAGLAESYRDFFDHLKSHHSCAYHYHIYYAT